HEVVRFAGEVDALGSVASVPVDLTSQLTGKTEIAAEAAEAQRERGIEFAVRNYEVPTYGLFWGRNDRGEIEEREVEFRARYQALEPKRIWNRLDVGREDGSLGEASYELLPQPEALELGLVEPAPASRPGQISEVRQHEGEVDFHDFNVHARGTFGPSSTEVSWSGGLRADLTLAPEFRTRISKGATAAPYSLLQLEDTGLEPERAQEVVARNLEAQNYARRLYRAGRRLPIGTEWALTVNLRSPMARVDEPAVAESDDSASGRTVPAGITGTGRSEGETARPGTMAPVGVVVPTVADPGEVGALSAAELGEAGGRYQLALDLIQKAEQGGVSLATPASGQIEASGAEAWSGIVDRLANRDRLPQPLGETGVGAEGGEASPTQELLPEDGSSSPAASRRPVDAMHAAVMVSKKDRLRAPDQELVSVRPQDQAAEGGRPRPQPVVRYREEERRPPTPVRPARSYELRSPRGSELAARSAERQRTVEKRSPEAKGVRRKTMSWVANTQMQVKESSGDRVARVEQTRKPEAPIPDLTQLVYQIYNRIKNELATQMERRSGGF
ncbi:hypothetical protein ACFL59_01145, partial [Planctomycetota bacterium]